MNKRGLIVGLWLVVCSCASGPHPALEVASRDFDCPIKDLKRHEYTRIASAWKAATRKASSVKDCGGYGADAECRWARAKNEF